MHWVKTADKYDYFSLSACLKLLKLNVPGVPLGISLEAKLRGVL